MINALRAGGQGGAVRIITVSCGAVRLFDTADAAVTKYKFAFQAGVTQLVECDLAKVDVAGSNPVSRSIFFDPESAAGPRTSR
jgi:hypothetical protein